MIPRPRAAPELKVIMMQPRIQFLFCLIAYTLIVRLMPYVVMTDPTSLYYPWNFSPLTAVCLFGGAYLKDRRVSFVIPLMILFLSDLGIYAITGKMEWAFPAGRWALTYVSFTAATALGVLLRRLTQRPSALQAVAMGLVFEVGYFAVSNFLVWYTTSFTAEPIYSPTAAGLVQCYIAAIPFSGKSLLATMAFTTLLFSPLGVRTATEDNEPATGKLEPVRIRS